eukprot:3339140-Alexandrium_andersonii.AAC.1
MVLILWMAYCPSESNLALHALAAPAAQNIALTNLPSLPPQPLSSLINRHRSPIVTHCHA